MRKLSARDDKVRCSFISLSQTYVFVSIFLPLTKRVDVDVFLTSVLEGGEPFPENVKLESKCPSLPGFMSKMLKSSKLKPESDERRKKESMDSSPPLVWPLGLALELLLK